MHLRKVMHLRNTSTKSSSPVAPCSDLRATGVHTCPPQNWFQTYQSPPAADSSSVGKGAQEGRHPGLWALCCLTHLDRPRGAVRLLHPLTHLHLSCSCISLCDYKGCGLHHSIDNASHRQSKVSQLFDHVASQRQDAACLRVATTRVSARLQ